MSHLRPHVRLGAAALLLAAIPACTPSERLDARGYTPLMEAAERGDVARIHALVRQGADVDYQGRQVTHHSLLWPWVSTEWEDVPVDSLTPLMLAARAGRVASVRALLEEGANPNAETRLGIAHRTALFFAAEDGHLEVARALIAASVAREGYSAGESLRSAVVREHPDVALLLIDARVGLAAAAGALVEAARRGQAEVVRALVGADVPVRGEAGGSALLAAAGEGSVAAVRVLLAAGTYPDAHGIPVGWTALGLAAKRGDAELVATLLDAGAAVNATNPAQANATALILAARDGHVAVARLLVEHGADVRTRDRDGYTAAALAARAGHDELVALLAQAGASPGELRAFPLIEAVRRGDVGGVRRLIAAGADVNVRIEGDSRPVLVAAALAGSQEIVAALLAGGADVNTADAMGMTALIMATQAGNMPLVAQLLRAKADVNVRGWGGETALVRAAILGRVDLVRLLLRAGADERTREDALMRAAEQGQAQAARDLLAAGVGARGRTRALVEAARAGRPEVLRELVGAGAAVNERDEKGVTPLMWAAWAGDAESIRTLLAAGAEVNAVYTGESVGDARLPRSTGWTALVWAACNERTQAVAALVEAGADVQVHDSRGGSATRCAIELGDMEGVRVLRAAGASADVSERTLAETALRHAADTGNLERLEVLLGQGVDPNAADQYGERALILAVRKGRGPVVRLLIERGADVNAKRQDGTNALYWAKSWRHADIVEMLERAGAREEVPAWAREGTGGPRR